MVSIPTVAFALSVVFCPESLLAVYSRPDFSASVFGTLSAADSLNVTVRTAEGWLGFDPGTAQAATTGSFRYRWLPPETELEGADGLETVWGPKPEITYAMIFTETQVFTEPDTASIITASMKAGSAAQVLYRSGEWLLINLQESPEPENVQGWISTDEVSLSIP